MNIVERHERLLGGVGVGRFRIVDEQHPAKPADLFHAMRKAGKRLERTRDAIALDAKRPRGGVSERRVLAVVSAAKRPCARKIGYGRGFSARHHTVLADPNIGERRFRPRDRNDARSVGARLQPHTDVPAVLIVDADQRDLSLRDQPLFDRRVAREVAMPVEMVGCDVDQESDAGREVAMGGNIGVPVLDLPPPAAGRTHVVECSSYQIDLAPSLAPSVGLLINITPDHLDRHGDLARYAAIKERLVAQAEIALVGVDDEHCRDIYVRLKVRSGAPRTLAVSGVESPDADVWVSEHRVMAKGEAAPAADLARARALRGAHNGQNAAFAYAAARALGVERDRIARAFETFPGLAHRMEEVGRFGRVLFINDSKATNADAAEKALMSFHDIHWILGGRPKAGGVEPLRPLFSRVARAYLIGEASDEFARTLTGVVPFDRYVTLDAAIEAAAEDATQSRAHEPVVLLSPACASFDQFANFEARGDAFRAHVAKWLEHRAAGGTRAQTGR